MEPSDDVSLDFFQVIDVVIDGAIPSVDASDHELDVYALMQRRNAVT